ncbi:MAG: MarR family transcriptional regulator [Pseudonocardiales bacterium]|nr:MAG: MarR family transcriptional regulator [Pseudonocardiales bacterium]
MRQPTPHPNPSAAELSEAIVYSVYELVHQWQDLADERAKEFGLTGQQVAVLWNLSREQPSMGELADRLGCDASNITGLIDRLERRELVCRVADPSDARVKRVHLTPTGQQLTKRMRSKFFNGSPSVAGLSAADQRALLKLLRRATDLGTTDGASGRRGKL